MSRVAPVQPPYPPDVAAQLESMMPAGVPPIGLFRTLARNLPMTAVLAEPQLLDLLLLCGWYHAISFTARAVRVALEPGAPRFADVVAP